MEFLTIEEYKEMGFKCGVEIHQQLATQYKQFCRCPAGHYSKEYDAEVLRHMRPTLSELGEYDGTALMEFKTKKEIIYRLHKDSVCTYEMDDTPPFLVNQEGLDIAIEIALLLNCQIIDEMHIARKQYLDGSIPTGFQRTAIVGVEGWVPYKDKKIRIIQVNYEEDSCREVSDVGHTIVFKTDRLGIPLMEAITYPDMETPWEAAGVVERLGRIFRVTGKVRRGIGSVRQDVNVSIQGGTRIEIKGVPKIGYIPNLVHIEALRQKSLLELRDVILKKGIQKDSLVKVEKDVSHLFKNCAFPVFQNALKKGHSIRGIKLCGLSGILNFPTQPDIHFDRELAGRVRVIACLDEQPVIFHTDNYPLYQGYREDLRKLRELFQSTEKDVIVLVWGPKEDTITATEEIYLRILDALEGVPSETRQAFPDGTTDFERILPGPDRMYPDTDLPPTRLDRQRIQKIQAQLPELPWKREERYKKYGIPEHIAYSLAISPRAALFDRIEKELEVDMKLVAISLVQHLKAIQREGYPVDTLSDTKIFELFQLYSQGKFYKEIIPYLLKCMIQKPDLSIEEILEKENIRIFSEKECEEIIEQVIKKDFSRPKYCMGKIMNYLRGRVPAKETIAFLHKKLGLSERE